MKPLVKNAADESQVTEADKKSKFGRERDLNDLRLVLSTPYGRRFVWRYLATCGVFSSSYDPSGSTVYFKEGRRDIGLRLLDEINEASPESYLVMLNESKERDKNVS